MQREGSIGEVGDAIHITHSVQERFHCSDHENIINSILRKERF